MTLLLSNSASADLFRTLQQAQNQASVNRNVSNRLDFLRTPEASNDVTVSASSLRIASSSSSSSSISISDEGLSLQQSTQTLSFRETGFFIERPEASRELFDEVEAIENEIGLLREGLREFEKQDFALQIDVQKLSIEEQFQYQQFDAGVQVLFDEVDVVNEQLNVAYDSSDFEQIDQLSQQLDAIYEQIDTAYADFDETQRSFDERREALRLQGETLSQAFEGSESQIEALYEQISAVYEEIGEQERTFINEDAVDAFLNDLSPENRERAQLLIDEAQQILAGAAERVARPLTSRQEERIERIETRAANTVERVLNRNEVLSGRIERLENRSDALVDGVIERAFSSELDERFIERAFRALDRAVVVQSRAINLQGRADNLTDLNEFGASILSKISDISSRPRGLSGENELRLNEISGLLQQFGAV